VPQAQEGGGLDPAANHLSSFRTQPGKRQEVAEFVSGDLLVAKKKKAATKKAATKKKAAKKKK